MKYLLTGEQTERLDFRLVTKDDYDVWLPLFKEKHIGTFLGMPEGLSQTEKCDYWFKKVFHRYDNGLGGMNALIHKTSGEFIGQCGLLIQTIEDEERLEIGYSILPKHWRNGYASEAAKKCKDFCFEHEFADNLISVVHVDNIASEIVAKKNGMSFEKCVDDCNVFSITRESWIKQND